MNIKSIFTLISAVFTSLAVRAIVANPEPTTVVQPDGTVIEITLHGDEFLDYTTTTDGFTVVKSEDGFYHYAQLDTDGRLVATGVKAHSVALRTADELSFVSTLKRNIRPAMTAQATEHKATLRRITSSPNRLSAGHFDYTKFRGLVILVEYNDCPFSRSDINDVVSDMITQRNYTGYMSNAMIPEKVTYTGSVRDYFYDSSFGAFDPQFDVYGPIKIDYSQYAMQKTTNAQTIVNAVLEAADEQIDYSLYDTDGNREVDMVYFIFSGHGSNFTGNDSRLVWPHASQVYSSGYKDGVKFGRYACSTELYGKESVTYLDGIGTICHEFSHVLGLPDEYDTDYESSGGQSVHPAKWSVMASGSYLNSSRTPCGYSLYERYSAGFVTPQLIETEGTFSIDPINVGNSGYRINCATSDEYFLIEDRQQTGWDAYLPGHGMLVFRVDSTDVKVWESNDINVNPAHNYYELLRATPKYSSTGTTVTDSQGDPFPGSGNVTVLDNFTTPNLRSWIGLATPITLSDISESSDGKITFRTNFEATESDYENFESIEPFTGDASDVAGSFCTWSFSGANVVALGGEEESSMSNHAVAMVKSSELISGTIVKPIQNLSFSYANPTTSAAIVRTYYSTDNGVNWIVMKTVEGTENTSVAAGDTVTLHYTVMLPENIRLKFTQFTGNKKSPCYLDDVCVVYEKTSSGIDSITTGGNAFTAVAMGDNTVLLNGLSAGKAVDVYSIIGTNIFHSVATDGSMQVELPQRGVYIVSHNNQAVKLAY